ncbi:lysoplasmalogenase-like protein TMEM86A isoform X2 [Stegostoma tigrinum]|uniref:lysoplasmalogenase-like protein TMEM86A isoform X2 n=1 Tax=Stegostoma tigrinum TaxID=3053191 RepID=UPI00286FC59B|nr:lysoplasmalogenase-like protein TMEM86A isoform X2 [Stegostoma tigrinum]
MVSPVTVSLDRKYIDICPSPITLEKAMSFFLNSCRDCGQNTPMVLLGLLMFAITHILYTSAFGMKPLNPEPGCGVVVICGIFYCLLYPYLSGPFTYLVAVYIALIGFMGWRAIAGVQLFNDLWTWTKLCACLGAVLFMVSDLTIAVNKFCFPVPYSRAIIMATYYAAQMLISLSVVECKDDNDGNIRKMN